MSDITLTVKVKNAAGEWVASTPVYDLTGTVDTPQLALGTFTSALEHLSSGANFLPSPTLPLATTPLLT